MSIALLVGRTGSGKTSLLPRLTTGDRRENPISTSELEAFASVFEPARLLNQAPGQEEVFVCDTRGIGDTAQLTKKTKMRATAPILARLLAGATIAVLCLPHDRWLDHDVFTLAVLLTCSDDLPVIVCFTKADLLDPGNSNSAKDRARAWREAQRENFERFVEAACGTIFGTAADLARRLSYCSVSSELGWTDELRDLLVQQARRPICGGMVAQARRDYEVSPTVAVPVSSREHLMEAARSLSTDLLLSELAREFWVENESSVIYYATSRKGGEEIVVGGSNRRPAFSDEPTEPPSVKYGMLYMSKRRAVASGTSEIKSGEPLSDLDSLVEKVSAHLSTIQNMDERQVLVYIHGYNNTFDAAAGTAGALLQDLKVPVVVFFSWPSRASLLGYCADEAAIENCHESFAGLLEALSLRDPAVKVHVLAHSLGNRCFIRAMEVLHGKESRARFGQLFLCAPDVDRRFFLDRAAKLDRRALRVTLYTSPHDNAVGASETLHRAARIGKTPPVTICHGVDTVVVSRRFDWSRFGLLAGAAGTGHSYFAEAEPLIHDLHCLIHSNLNPNKRIHLENMGGFWEIL